MSGAGAIWVDGVLVDAGAPAIAADDHGFLVGDGVFETLLVRAGRPLFWSRHLARLDRALSTTGLAPLREDRLRAAVGEVLAATGVGEARLRITVSSGPGGAGLTRGSAPTTVVSATPLTAAATQPAPARVVTAAGARNERAPLVGVKTTSYAEAAALHAWATSLGADDVLLGDSRDRLSEGLTANVFVVLDGHLVTPSLVAGCLPGIVRDLVLEAGLAQAIEIPLDRLADAEEVFLTSSVAGVRPVASIDGGPVPVVDGPVAAVAREAVAAAEAVELAERH